jgi:Fe-S-cluster containining protein
MEVAVPNGPVGVSGMLPAFRTVAGTLLDISIADEERLGRNVSCAKGCGACCRQLVPISAIEARELAKVVEKMPPARREIILERFAQAREKLADAEMLDPLLHPDLYSDEQMRALGREYFKLAIACPFLEEESCSIYPDRPITCREYLVTSPAANCSAPAPDTVRVVPMLAGAVWTAVARLEEGRDTRFIRWVPLILALEFADAAEAEPPPREGKEWIQEFFRLIAREPKPQKAKAT